MLNFLIRHEKVSSWKHLGFLLVDCVSKISADILSVLVGSTLPDIVRGVIDIFVLFGLICDQKPAVFSCDSVKTNEVIVVDEFVKGELELSKENILRQVWVAQIIVEINLVPDHIDCEVRRFKKALDFCVICTLILITFENGDALWGSHIEVRVFIQKDIGAVLGPVGT